MLSACLYIRVSTDEQAIRGFSQRNQQERLNKLCQSNSIEIINTVFEDYSAKSFNRPAWNRLMTNFHQSKTQRSNVLLFTKWDRFSRNIADAYYIISRLHGLSIEPQAIEQPLDLSIPENKIIIAVYIATSEVDNEKRSMNVKQNIHRARLEGRWMARPPIGYTAELCKNRQKIIKPTELESCLIRKAFLLIAETQLPVESIFKQLLKAGLNCSISHFWRIIRNPIYCGKLKVPAFEGEKAYWIKGTHQSIVGSHLFNKVQHILDSRKNWIRSCDDTTERFMLRGFIRCPVCKGLLTGSGSQGKRRKYYYYHCHHCHHFRVRADKLNDSFCVELNKLSVRPGYQNIYKLILRHIRKEVFSEQTTYQHSIRQTLDRSISRILRAQELSVKGEISKEDFLLIKAECEKKIHLIGPEWKRSIIRIRRNQRNLKKAVTQISRLGELLSQFSLIQKRELIDLMLSEEAVVRTENFPLCELANLPVRYIFEGFFKNELPCSDRIPVMDYGDYYLGSELNQQLCNKVIVLEKQHQFPFPTIAAQNIIDFLTKLACLSADLLFLSF